MSDERSKIVMQEPQFVIRVRLPNPNGFHSSPSGDTDYEEAHKKALHSALPPGFEINYPRTGVVWPQDNEGMTWVPLRCTDKENALAHWRNEAINTQRELTRVLGVLKGLTKS